MVALILKVQVRFLDPWPRTLTISFCWCTSDSAAHPQQEDLATVIHVFVPSSLDYCNTFCVKLHLKVTRNCKWSRRLQLLGHLALIRFVLQKELYGHPLIGGRPFSDSTMTEAKLARTRAFSLLAPSSGISSLGMST